MGLRRSVALSAGSIPSNRTNTGIATRTSSEFRGKQSTSAYTRRDLPLCPQDSEKTLYFEESAVETTRPKKSSPVNTIGKVHERYANNLSANERASVELSIPKKKPTPEYQLQSSSDYENDAFEDVPKPPTDNFHENAEEEQLDVSAYLIPCDICSRKFMSDRLEKHRIVCLKANTKQRKVFDMRAARVQGTELEKYVLKKPPGQEPVTVSCTNQTKKSNWRAKHAAFQQMVAAAKNPNAVPAAPIVNPDYVTCPTCERRFNEEAGKRHMPICKEKAQKKQMCQPSSGKGESLKRRTGYKPPSPRKLK